MFEEVNPRLPLMLTILVVLFITLVIGEVSSANLLVTKFAAGGGFLIVLVVLAHRYSLQAREELRK